MKCVRMMVIDKFKKFILPSLETDKLGGEGSLIF